MREIRVWEVWKKRAQEQRLATTFCKQHLARGTLKSRFRTKHLGISLVAFVSMSKSGQYYPYLTWVTTSLSPPGMDILVVNVILPWKTHNPEDTLYIEDIEDIEAFTPRGWPNSLWKRLEILTCDWPKGWNRSQLLLHLHAGPIWWYKVFNQKMHGLTWLELVELGAPKMEGQFLAYEPMSHFKKNELFTKIWLFSMNQIC
jgi:hypothetical protein